MRNRVEKPQTRICESEADRKSEIRSEQISADIPSRFSGFRFWSFLQICGFGFLICVAGCSGDHPDAPPPQPPAELMAASAALSSRQPEAAIIDARAFLMNHPTGPLAAQAMYFEGRGEEDIVPVSAADRARNLSEAHSNYLLALQQKPAKALEADIHISLSNVAFYQDEYAECIQEASAAMSMIPADSPMKGNLLYRTGVSQQRLGRFTDADQTFRQVQLRYPNTPVAAAAKGSEGQRKFYVQLATFRTQDTANLASASLQSRGMVVSERTDARGETILDLGSFNTFPQAKKAKDQMLAEFPDAIIVP